MACKISYCCSGSANGLCNQYFSQVCQSSIARELLFFLVDVHDSSSISAFVYRLAGKDFSECFSSTYRCFFANAPRAVGENLRSSSFLCYILVRIFVEVALGVCDVKCTKTSEMMVHHQLLFLVVYVGGKCSNA